MVSQEQSDDEIKKLLEKAVNEENTVSDDANRSEVLDFIAAHDLKEGSIKVPVVALYKAYVEWATKTHTPIQRDKFLKQFGLFFKQRKPDHTYRFYKLNKDFPISVVEWQQFLRENRRRYGFNKKDKT